MQVLRHLLIMNARNKEMHLLSGVVLTKVHTGGTYKGPRRIPGRLATRDQLIRICSELSAVQGIKYSLNGIAPEQRRVRIQQTPPLIVRLPGLIFDTQTGSRTLKF
ncbi:hypothetical protein EVAR_38191_1 [Eumeta japonica]|uniref:Uncharacterized protein n=1 Tax=Eumeta variegata TaxID=151549 RepID=A0A4C1WEC8_EUMVA|nr:hypothetical protein EVAR_38191_1 [Eumeta japonica]